MLHVELHKQLGAFQLDVAFETDGDILALLGASGCGKSMTLKCIAGIETPDWGHIALDGHVLFDSQRRINLPPQKRQIGYLFQQYALFPNMTVLQNILAGCRQKDRAARLAEAEAQIARFHLTGLEGKKPATLSGGQQQRVALARIFANHPAALLLDEPFSALDSYLKWQLEMELADLLRGYDGDVLYVSHSRDEVYRLCDSVCVLANGSSEPKLPVESLFSAPGTVSAALLSGCKNISAAEALDLHTVQCLDWGVTLRTEAAVPQGLTAVGVRAHFIQPGTGENTFSCRVARVIDDLFSTILMLETPGGKTGRSLLRMELPKQTWPNGQAPESLQIAITPTHVMLLTGKETV